MDRPYFFFFVRFIDWLSFAVSGCQNCCVVRLMKYSQNRNSQIGDYSLRTFVSAIF